MKIKSLVSEYKRIAKEMKAEAKNYNYLCDAVKSNYCTKETFIKYQESWEKLISLNEKAYRIMYEYKKLCGTTLYKAMFFLGVLPKQNSFRFINGTQFFKCEQLINLLNLK